LAAPKNQYERKNKKRKNTKKKKKGRLPFLFFVSVFLELLMVAWGTGILELLMAAFKVHRYFGH